jgi:peptidoglycan/LPS O-acetylase OafA/YrhL
MRIYPPLLAAIGLTLLLSRLGMAGTAPIPWRHVLLSATLTDVFASLPHPILAVSWTLSIEVIFYLHVALLLPVVRTRPLLATAALTVWSVAATEACEMWFRITAWGPAHAMGLVLEYLPVFAGGMVTWAWWQRRLSGWGAFALGALAYSAFVHNVWRVQPAYLTGSDDHVRQAGYAVVIFVACLLAVRRGGAPGPVRGVARVSYALYLVHFPLGFWLLSWLIPRIGYASALALTLVVVGATSVLLWRTVERPAQRAARALLARHRSRYALSSPPSAEPGAATITSPRRSFAPVGRRTVTSAHLQ